MDATQIVELIRKRHQEFWDRQIGASTSDPDHGEAAQRARDIADEYEDLLTEIEHTANLGGPAKK
jgi:hypothetical protein